MKVRSPRAHEWAGNDYHCELCYCSMHCPHCGTGCGAQGHMVKDANGYYFHCQEPDRWQAQINSLNTQPTTESTP